MKTTTQAVDHGADKILCPWCRRSVGRNVHDRMARHGRRGTAGCRGSGCTSTGAWTQYAWVQAFVAMGRWARR